MLAALIAAISSAGVLTCLANSWPSMRPLKNAMRLMISDIPCSTSRPKPTGISSLTGQTIRPPALLDISAVLIEYCANDTP